MGACVVVAPEGRVLDAALMLTIGVGIMCERSPGQLGGGEKKIPQSG